MSCQEWTGIRLGTLLQEAGVEPQAKWLLAEGADASGMSRSIPIEKAMDDAMVALYQNGERVRPSNGYPMRLLLPGWEGNMNVKWLRRIKLTEGPTMTKDETSKYTILLPSGKALQFVFPLEAKSMITHPSPGLMMRGPGLYEISGLAWSGYGKIAKVEVSADGGKSWGACRIARTGAAKGADALPHGLAMERRCRRAAKPLDRRHRQRAADPRAAHRAAWRSRQLPQQHDPELGRLRQWRGEKCLCVSLLASAAVLLATAVTASAQSPDLGQPISQQDLAPWDISIGPDGAGLPPGSGTVKQGEAVFMAKCQGCHGAKGAGQPNDRLVGGQGTLAGDRPVKTIGSYWPYATTLFDYIRRAMPLPRSKSLTNEEVYAVTAYLLNLNGIIPEGETIDARTLPKVTMPNRDGFIVFSRGE